MEWRTIVEAEKSKPYYAALKQKVEEEYRTTQVFPPYDKMFTAFALTPYEEVKCVILGQDPYHNDNQAMGLSFSVPEGEDIPPSLRNIYKELHNELGFEIPASGDLTGWARQGVLLLNAVLTVRAHCPASHSSIGWETFTDSIITALNSRRTPVVFMLWGNYARSKKKLITNTSHLVLEAAHPSPLSASRGFFGCGHFAKCNEFLESTGQGAIDWQAL